jgi:hypothetical protein
MDAFSRSDGRACRAAGVLVGGDVVWCVALPFARAHELTLPAASPYLLDLGLSKSHMALVFLAGPLSGLIVQPLVGMYGGTCIVLVGH